MKKESKIKNLEDLRMEIARLKVIVNEQEVYISDQYHLLNNKIAAPVRFLKSLVSWVPGADLAKDLFAKGHTKDEDWLSKGLRIGLPFILNRFFLRRAGFIKRMLVTLLSQQAAGALNTDRLSVLVGKVADFVRPPKRKKGKITTADYGIPPDSEAY